MQATEEMAFRGCLRVIRGQEVLREAASGFADLPNQVPNTQDTRFATASCGKVFVAVAILQLVDQGRLRLEDRLGDLADFELRAIDPDITVAELLSHTSGIPDYFDESVMAHYEDLWQDLPNYRIRTNRDLLPLFVDKPMMYPHGTRFQYNNTGFVVLAMILERVTGLAFDACLRERVFEPCGMLRTGYFELDRLPAGCAANYIEDGHPDGPRTNIYSVDAKGTGAGGAFTTTGDICRFWQGLVGHRLLSPEMTALMLANHSGEAGCYGYGVWLMNTPGGALPYIQGSDPGVSFVSVCEPRSGLVCVLVSNYGDDVWTPLDQVLQSHT